MWFCDQAGRRERRRRKEHYPGAVERIIRRGLAFSLKRFLGLNRGESLPILFLNHLRLTYIFSLPPLAFISQKFPKISDRYLISYIAHSLPTSKRREILMYHYKEMTRTFRREFFDKFFSSGLPLWKFNVKDEEWSITIESATSPYFEADVILWFCQNRTRIYRLAFSIAPADLIAVGSGSAMLICNVQGEAAFYEEVRRATKECHDVTPAYLLLSAAQGVASALSISLICGVKSAEQLSTKASAAEHFGYDQFWESVAAEKREAWYLLGGPLWHKPLSSVPRTHRRRTRRKRAFRDAVAMQAAESLAPWLKVQKQP